MKPISSAIPPLPTADDTQTGTQLSAHGSETRSSGALSVQPNRLLERSPAANLAAAVSSLLDCGLLVRHEVTGSRFPPEGGWEPVMSLTVTSSDSLETETAEKIVDALGAPAPRDKLIEWITVCAVLTVATKDDELSGELKMRAYAERLAEFPGDIVHAVLEEWPRKSKWFPAWAELEAAIQKHMGIRPLLIDRVRSEIRRRRK